MSDYISEGGNGDERSILCVVYAHLPERIVQEEVVSPNHSCCNGEKMKNSSDNVLLLNHLEVNILLMALWDCLSHDTVI